MLKLNPEQIKKILIIRLSAIGDVVHCLPTLKVLRHSFPQAEISWAVDTLAANLLEGHPYLQQVLVIPAKELDKKLKKFSTLREGMGEIKKISQQLQAEKFDLSIDLHGLLKSGIVSYLSKAPVRLVHPQARDFSQFFATHRVPPISPSPHLVDNYLDTARYLGLEIDKVEFPLSIGKKEEESSRRFLKASRLEEGQLLIGLNPGASRVNKQWPPEKFAQLGNQLKEKYDCQIILFGSPGDLGLVRKITSQMHSNPLIAAGKTSLQGLAALIKECNLFISGDTGPLHMAVAVGTPVVALFGPTDYHRSGPYGEKKVIISTQLPTIESIQVEYVLKAIEKLEPLLSPALPSPVLKP